MGKYEWRLILVLTAICVFSGGVLGWVNSLTAPVIEAQQELAKQRALQEALPDATVFTEDPTLLAELEGAGRSGLWKCTVLTMMEKIKAMCLLLTNGVMLAPSGWRLG